MNFQKYHLQIKCRFVVKELSLFIIYRETISFQTIYLAIIMML